MQRRSERGVALLVAIFALLLLSAIGAGLCYMADTETSMNANFRSYQRAYFAALAGIEEARARLVPGNAQSITPPLAMPGGNRSVIYVLNPAMVNGTLETIDPVNPSNPYFDTELCHENFSGLGVGDPGAGVPCTTAPSGTNWYAYVNSVSPYTQTGAALPFKWARITLKANGSAAPYYVDGGGDSSTYSRQVCWNGDTEMLLPSGYTRCDLPAAGGAGALAPVYNITAYGKGSHRIAQKEVGQLFLPPLPAALTLDGPSPHYDAASSNNFVVDGHDHASCGSTQQSLPGVGAYDDPAHPTSPTAVNGIISAIPDNRLDHYTGSGADPDVENVYSLLGPLYGTPGGLQGLVSLITSSANQVLNGPVSDPNIGSNANPRVTVVKGDLTLTGDTSGAGILVVTGTLNTSGNTSFAGLLLVVGKGVWNANGAGSGEIRGAVLVAKIVDADGRLLSSLGSPSLDWDGGGNNGITYDSCWIGKASQGAKFHVISARELPY
jgi:hypothetical protein